MDKYDIAIVGAGPAGLSAALTARARNLKVLLVSNRFGESALARASRIENYPGLPAVSGRHLLSTMTAQVLATDCDLVSERVITITALGAQTSRYFSLTTAGDVFDARSVILALGTQQLMSLPGEREFLGRGVSYCATCDGMLYRGQRIVVYGLFDEAISEANFLADIGCDVVWLAPQPVEGLAASIETHIGLLHEIVARDGAIGCVRYRVTPGSASMITTPDIADLQEIACQGVFILRPTIAPDALIRGIELIDGQISVDKNMATSIAGVFAAGDCVGRPYQIAKAVGEGQQAALSAQSWLDSLAVDKRDGAILSTLR